MSPRIFLRITSWQVPKRPYDWGVELRIVYVPIPIRGSGRLCQFKCSSVALYGHVVDCDHVFDPEAKEAMIVNHAMQTFTQTFQRESVTLHFPRCSFHD